MSNLEQIIARQEESYKNGDFSTIAPHDWNEENVKGYNSFKEEFWNWHSSSIKEILEGVQLQITEQDRYDLEDDRACGDPECCGERSYWIGKVKDGEYIKRVDTINYLEETIKQLK